MGNGKKKKLSSKEEGLLLEQPEKLGRFNLVNMPGGFIGVASADSQQVTGYVVPKNVAALYFRFWRMAVAIQELETLRAPTQEEMLEIMKRYLNKLGAVHEDFLHEAIMEVLGGKKWKPAKGWDPDALSKFELELMKRKPKDEIINPYSIYDPEEEINYGRDKGKKEETDKS